MRRPIQLATCALVCVRVHHTVCEGRAQSCGTALPDWCELPQQDMTGPAGMEGTVSRDDAATMLFGTALDLRNKLVAKRFIHMPCWYQRLHVQCILYPPDYRTQRGR